MRWDYRIIKHDADKHIYFAVHEVYYDKNGKVENWTSQPIRLSAESKKDIAEDLKLLLKDIDKPILLESELIKKDGK